MSLQIPPLDWCATGGLSLLGYVQDTVASGTTASFTPPPGDLKYILVQLDPSGLAVNKFVRWHPGGTASQGIRITGSPPTGSSFVYPLLFWIPISRKDFIDNFRVRVALGFDTLTVRIYFYGVPQM